ncbi:MAG TPA: DUF5318 family protein [Actinomycetota bacterium]|nr:DUF5318 family protein [Actinomycetota bacterium]
MAIRAIRPRRSKRSLLATVDYTLAKRALLAQVRTGLLGRADICDAHPELLRAAKNVGENCRRDCPVCSQSKLRLLAYVYGDGLKQDNGRVWPLDTGLSMAADRPGSWCYVVEVCTECQWNHLAEAFVARAG